MSSEEQNYGLLFLYFAPQTMVSKEEELNTVLELLAEIGDYVGLFLGFSLWSCAAWISDILENEMHKLEKEDQIDLEKSKELRSPMLKNASIPPL